MSNSSVITPFFQHFLRVRNRMRFASRFDIAYACVFECERARERMLRFMYYVRIREISETAKKKVEEEETEQREGKGMETREKNIVLVEIKRRYFFALHECMYVHSRTHGTVR